MLSEKEKRQEELADLHWLVEDARGRRIVNRIVRYCGLFKSVFRGQDGLRPDDLLVFNGAKQSVAQWLYGEIAQADYKGWQRMNEEEYERRMAEESEKQSRKKKKEGDGDADSVQS